MTKENQDYKIKDIGLADFDRKEIDIAEVEMPGLMSIRAKYGPNEESIMHQHNPGVVVFLKDTKHQLINEDGSKIDSAFKAGHVIWADAVTHKGINLEDKPLELVFFELK